jgi:hypothetical protein
MFDMSCGTLPASKGIKGGTESGERDEFWLRWLQRTLA